MISPMSCFAGGWQRAGTCFAALGYGVSSKLVEVGDGLG
jgi:hypothetical protein